MLSLEFSVVVLTYFDFRQLWIQLTSKKLSQATWALHVEHGIAKDCCLSCLHIPPSHSPQPPKGPHRQIFAWPRSNGNSQLLKQTLCQLMKHMSHYNHYGTTNCWERMILNTNPWTLILHLVHLHITSSLCPKSLSLYGTLCWVRLKSAVSFQPPSPNGEWTSPCQPFLLRLWLWGCIISKKSPTHRTQVSRTPKKPEYLIARSQLGPLGFGLIQFLMDNMVVVEFHKQVNQPGI